jgi:hypothetical protein
LAGHPDRFLPILDSFAKSLASMATGVVHQDEHVVFIKIIVADVFVKIA